MGLILKNKEVQLMTVYVLSAIPVDKFTPDSKEMALITQRCDVDEIKAALADNPNFI